MQKIFGKNFTKNLSIALSNVKKKLFIGIQAVLEVTPPELIKIRHSVNFS